VDEGLGQVAAELALGNVEFFGEQAGWSAGGAVAFQPACGGDCVASLVVGERHEESAEEEGALGLAERSLVGLVAVAVAVVGELGVDRLQGGERAGVGGRDGAADGGQEQCGVGASVGG
jgi:hypothetical protein